MKYKAIVSGHIWKHKGEIDIEILSQVDNDEKDTGVFDDLEHDLLAQIEHGFDDDNSRENYFFMAIVESKFVKQVYLEGIDYDVEHEVKEIKSIDDI